VVLLQRKTSKQKSKMISAAIMLPTMAPMAVLSSLDKPGADVGPPMVELEVDEDWVDEPVGNDPVEVTGNEEVANNEEVEGKEEVWDDEGDDKIGDVGGKVEDGGVVKVGGEAFVELGGVGDTGSELAVFGGVGPP
jgi:hypothetical protein